MSFPSIFGVPRTAAAVGVPRTATSSYQVLPDGGPAGAGDAYFYNVSTSDGGWLTVGNTSDRWKGDYTAAGVTALQVDLVNLGSSALQVRAYLSGVIVDTSGHRQGGGFVSTIPFELPPDAEWYRVTFHVTAADLTWIPNSLNGNVEAALRSVNTISFRHQVNISDGGSGTPTMGSWGLDNITAVPEPASFMMLAVTTAMLRRRGDGGATAPILYNVNRGKGGLGRGDKVR